MDSVRGFGVPLPVKSNWQESIEQVKAPSKVSKKATGKKRRKPKRATKKPLQKKRKGKKPQSAKSPDVESSVVQRFTVDKGVNSSRVVQFNVEGQEDNFINLSQCYIKTTFRVVNETGDGLAPEVDTVFLGPHYGASLWNQVSVSLNNTVIPPGNDYPYTALFIDLLGASPEVRDDVMAPLAGWTSPHFGTSNVSKALTVNPDAFNDLKRVTKRFRIMTVYHRIHSDFLMSCSQLLPNRMQLGITLTRGKDSFALGRDPADGTDYRLEIGSVSLYVRRVTPNPALRSMLQQRLSNGGKLHYQRLHVIAFPCAKDSLTWTWHNCFNNVAPRRVFLALVSQEAYFGSYNRLGTYLESMNVSRVRFMLDGREILAEPYTCKWKYYADGTVDWESSDAKSAFAGLNQVTDVFAAPRQHAGIRYSEYTNGSTIFAVDLQHQDAMNLAPGSLDVMVEFAAAAPEPLMVLLCGEHPKTLTFDGNRQIVAL